MFVILLMFPEKPLEAIFFAAYGFLILIHVQFILKKSY